MQRRGHGAGVGITKWVGSDGPIRQVMGGAG